MSPRFHTYDYQNRLVKKQYPSGTPVNYTFDGAGRMTQVTDGTGTYTFAYDNMGRLTSATTNYSFTTFGNETVQYVYDAASNRTRTIDPQHLETFYSYDALNRLSNLSGVGGTNFGFSYDDLSRRTQLTRNNGVTTNYTYDSLSRLLSVLHQVGTTTLDGAAYTYDAAGNRMSKSNYLNGVTENYGYDNIYQLLQVTQGATTTESYTYDLVGNRLSSLGMSPYQYNASNQLTSTPAAAYTYDNDGNTKTKVDVTGTTTYTWDFENRLAQVVLPGTGGTLTFKYDPFGRRIQKSGPLGTTNSLYDGMNLLEEVDQSGNVLARYTHTAHDPDELEDEPLAHLRSGTTSYYQQDGINSVTSLTNPAGALANSYTFDSFGKLTASTGTLVNPFQYAGREFDPETGIYQYRMRYYDQNVGRFLSEDALGFNGGDSNFYAYVLNSPTGLVDPLGLQHQPGGPQHPAPGVSFRCQGGPNRTQGDSCDVIMAKMALIAYYLADHALWDMQHGGNRHASDIDSLAGAFRRCLEMFNKYCVGKCKDKPKEPPPTDPFWWIPVIPRIPGPFPVIIDPCILNPYASYCHNGPQA